MKKIFSIILCIYLLCTYVYSQEQQKIMTRSQVIEKLSAADFVKKKIGDLLNFGTGYDITKINRTNLAPTISFIKLTPIKVPPDNRTVVLLTAKVTDPRGPDNINGVRADLSTINKLPNMMLVDNGLWGDASAGDGVYTLQTSVGYDVQSGSKDIPVAVSNKLGWVALGKTGLDVQQNPRIIEAKSDPTYTKADGTTILLLTVRTDNPGRQEDIKEVVIDLRPIGGDNNVRMIRNEKENNLFYLSTTVKEGIGIGLKTLSIRTTNINGGSGSGELLLEVQ
jgi:hypothetical protein